VAAITPLDKKRSGRSGVAQRLRDQRRVEQRQRRAALRFGNQHPGHAEFGQRAPGPGVVRAIRLAQRAHALHGQLLAQRAAHAGFQQPLLFGESEIHLSLRSALALAKISAAGRGRVRQ